jgi:hypothetical protein
MIKISEFFKDVLHEIIYYVIICPLSLWFKIFKPKYNFTESDIPKLANLNLKEPYTLYIGRESTKRSLPRSKWCNRFGINKDRSRVEALLLDDKDKRSNKQLMNSLHELAGHTLGCYCYSSKLQKGKLCHGHTLIKLFKEKYKIQ